MRVCKLKKNICMSILISNEALDFMRKLEKNNNRDWFEEHKTIYKEHERTVKTFMTSLHQHMNQHDEIDKMKMFRIYRDVRFSKDKTPYKTHYAASFNRVKPRLRGGYYIQIKPGKSFIATGFWDPNKEDLLRIRKELEMDADEFREIIENPSFKKAWVALVGDAVKTAPKGFNKEHPAIDLIRFKQFIFTKEFTDKEVTAKNFLEKVDKSFQAIRPFFDYMSDVLTTDLNGVSLLDR